MLGHDPAARDPDLRARVGIVLQSSGIYRYLTVRESVAHWAGFYPRPRDVEEVISIVGLEESAEQRANKLSGGQQRRLDLALALVGDPELVFLDEPTTGFDPAARRAAWGTIRSLQELGKTVLLTTHYLDEAQALADRVAIIKDGQILAEGPPSSLGAGAGRSLVSWRAPGGEIRTRETDDPTTLLHELTGDALARGERLEDLSVTRPQPRGDLPRADRRRRRPHDRARDRARPRARGRRRRTTAPSTGAGSPGASTGSSARCSGATRARRSSTSCCRCCSSACSARSSPATRRSSRSSCRASPAWR